MKKLSLPILFGFSIVSYSNELIEINMESVLEVGRENQELSASSQDAIDQTCLLYTSPSPRDRG